MMENYEIWKDCKGYEGLYQVSNLGRVKRLAYYKNVCSGGKQYCEEKILKPQKRKRGYQAVMLSKNNKVKSFLIHRLVAIVFISCVVNDSYPPDRNSMFQSRRLHISASA